METVKSKFGNVTLPTPIHSVFAEHFDRHFTCYYNKNPNSLLNGLCDKHGSDKGEIATSGHPYPWTSHTYADFIERRFEHCREYIRSVFECGLGTNNPTLASSMGEAGRPGASLRVWRDYFPNATVIGADIDADTLFTEDRIATYQCDQTSADSIAALWSSVGDVEFDLMIDDGLHTYEAGVSLFEGSFAKLKPGGLYIIEDVNITALIHFANYFMARNHSYEFITLYRKTSALIDNSMVVIRKP